MADFKHMIPLTSKEQIQVRYSKLEVNDYILILHFLGIAKECLGNRSKKSKRNIQKLTTLTRYLKALI